MYPRSEVARAHGAGVETETNKPAEAYAPFAHWKLGRPEAWRGCHGLSLFPLERPHPVVARVVLHLGEPEPSSTGGT